MTSQDTLSEIKIKPVIEKIQNYINKLIKHIRRMDGDRQTATLNYEILAVWETKPRTTLQKTDRLLMGPEKVTRSQTLQAT
jgi:hypothetical protein